MYVMKFSLHKLFCLLIGVITLSRLLHDQTNKELHLSVMATDHGKPPMSSQVPVKLFITSQNQFAPVFVKKAYEVTIAENISVGSNVVTVSASDKDVGVNGKMSYAIAGGNDGGWFTIGKDDGIVKIKKELDFDEKAQHFVNVTATDGGLAARTTSVILTVYLTDVNDNPPKWDRSTYDGYVAENLPPGTSVMTLSAHDADSAPNSATGYSIIGGDKQMFRLHARTGELTTLKSFDYEEKSEYVLDVVASNEGDSSLFTAATVHVHITGVNEYFPHFLIKQYSFKVSEMAELGTEVGTVVAIDQDKGQDGVVHYSIIGKNRNRGFTVERETGRILVSDRLDRELASELVLVVLAKNPGSIYGNDTDTCEVHITVQDANDPPVFQPKLYSKHLLENASVGALVVKVSAFDRDLRSDYQKFTYHILEGNIEDAFVINPTNGQIRSARPLDRELVPVYNLTVAAVDTGLPPQTGTATVTITLDDVNDHGPVFHDEDLTGYVAEGLPIYTAVMTLIASDPDSSANGPPFIYSLAEGSANDYFTLEPRTGVLRTMKVLDREAQDHYELNIQVMDSGTPRMSSTHTVHVVVEDINDSPSVQRGLLIAVHSFHGRLPLGKIASVIPNDKDLSGDFSCEIVKGDLSVFSIPRDCDLHILQPLSENAFYTLNISASDGIHSKVYSIIQVQSSSFTNATLDNSITLRIKNVTANMFARRYYDVFIKALSGVVGAGNSAEIYSLQDVEGILEVRMAVVQDDKRYISPKEVVQTFTNNIEKTMERNLRLKFGEVGYDPCAQSSCQNGAECSSKIIASPDTAIADSPSFILTSLKTHHTYQCYCPTGYTGKHCDIHLDQCHSNICRNGGSCSVRAGIMLCSCSSGYHGMHCEMDVDECLTSNMCQNGGICQNLFGSYKCECPESHTGANCEITVSQCTSSPCLNSGTCVVEGSSFQCQCGFGFYGKRCELSSYGFQPLSYMEFPQLDERYNKIVIEFSTLQKNALLLYNFDDSRRDLSRFLSIELQNGHPVLSYKLSSQPVRVKVERNVANAQWYRLTAQRRGKVSYIISFVHLLNFVNLLLV